MLTKQTRKILSSMGVIALAATFVLGGTNAFFSDTESSSGNVFTAGAIDLKVDHAGAWYNDELCDSNCNETGDQLVLNGGFEQPALAGGTWQVFSDASQTDWVVESGDGLEIQNNVAGAPHTGNQHAELDSNNSSSISQVINTQAGQRYRFSFWYSPRPGNADGDNAIAYEVRVESGGTVLLNGTVEASPSGATTWVQYTYDFIAAGDDSKIIFEDADTSNSFGGYIDDVSVRELECAEGGYGQAGQCKLWGEKDLENGDYFWNFGDIKPQDSGRNVMSLHVDDNDAWTCLAIQNGEDLDNDVNDAEVDAGDDENSPVGELSQNMDLFVWMDLDADGVYEPGSGEEDLHEGSFGPLVDIALHDSTTGNGMHVGATTEYIGMAWCAGDQAVNHGTGDITCDGTGVSNIAQTDSFTADLVAYAEQSRNNSSFTCAGVAQNDETKVGVNAAGFVKPAENSCHEIVDPGESIQAAINNVSDGQTVCLNDGVHDSGNTFPIRVNKDNVTLTSLNGANVTSVEGAVVIDNDGVTVSGLTLEDQAVLGEVAAVYINTGVDNATVAYNVLNGSGTGGSARGILTAINTVTGATITHNDISNFATGIFLNNSQNMTVENNTLTGNNVGVSNDYPSGNVLQYNHIVGNNTEGVGYFGDGTSDLDVNYNNIYNNGAGNSDVASYGGAEVDAENNWWGDLDPSDNVNGVVDYTPWATGAFSTY